MFQACQAGKKQEQVGEVTSFPSSQPSGLKAQACDVGRVAPRANQLSPSHAISEGCGGSDLLSFATGHLHCFEGAGLEDLEFVVD